MRTHAIRIHEHGGPEVLCWEEVEVAPPAPGEVLLRQTAVGLNFIDIYHRQGLYPIDDLPFIPGLEGVGVVEEVHGPAAGLTVGARVAYAYRLGAYCGHRWMPAAELVPVPDGLSDDVVATLMLKGLTAYYLLHETYRVRRNDLVLVHAVAGATGSIVAQWAGALGATVIGTAGTDEKVRLASERGCHHVINYAKEEFPGRVAEITGGRGVDVVYDGVGAATFAGSLRCLAEGGLMVSFGNASGPVPPLRLLDLSDRALFVARPSLKTYVTRPGFVRAGTLALFDLVARGDLKPVAVERCPLAQAGEAQRKLEERSTVGATVLVP